LGLRWSKDRALKGRMRKKKADMKRRGPRIALRKIKRRSLLE